MVQTHSSSCVLFNNAMSTEDYTMLNDRESKNGNGKDLAGSCLGLIKVPSQNLPG